MAATTFQVGETYECRSACDHETVYRWTVLKRTEKTVTLRDIHGREKRRGVKVTDDGAEMCFPAGKHSMCPVIMADRPEV